MSNASCDILTNILTVASSAEFTKEIFLLHGMTGSPEELLPAAKYLSVTCNARVWLPRLRGHEDFRSLKTVKASEWTEQILNLVEGVRKISPRPLSIVGISFGGLLALYAAQHFSASIEKLVLLAPPWRIKNKRQELLLSFLEYLPDKLLNIPIIRKKKRVKLVLPRICFSHHWVGAIVRMVKIRSALEPEWIKQPSLIIADREDHQVSPDSLTTLAGRLPSSNVIFVPEATHELLLGEKYQEILGMISDFLMG
jgi:esterase/lipase